ncbi:thioredoxin family protein [Thiocapsa imhoffii]|uniref:Thioredoxin family protein n=2 Tax=Thiocapsa imhoffii TaxID=382777 RepID=A0A9X0WIF5_9GAMM|nr:thioredoxin family protein [Thiocapsa imhoffii]MBK1645346.1 thioredoxin family protein [Thiocapsa imhoffii]
MKTSRVSRGLVGLTTLVATLSLGTVWAAPQVGQPAPDFQVVDTAGQTWTLAELTGKKTILEWTNHDCPFVIKHYDSGAMQALQRDATDAGYVWLSVISSAPGQQGHVSPAMADDLTERRDAHPTAVLLDESGAMGRAYDAKTTPHMYLIDESGVLVYMGGIDDKPTTNQADLEGANNFVRAAMADLAAGQPIAVPVTRPYGCSVKY